MFMIEIESFDSPCFRLNYTLELSYQDEYNFTYFLFLELPSNIVAFGALFFAAPKLHHYVDIVIFYLKSTLKKVFFQGMRFPLYCLHHVDGNLLA